MREKRARDQREGEKERKKGDIGGKDQRENTLPSPCIVDSSATRADSAKRNKSPSSPSDFDPVGVL